MHERLSYSEREARLQRDLAEMYELDSESRFSFVRSLIGSDELYFLPTMRVSDDPALQAEYIRDLRGEDDKGTTPMAVETVHKAGNQLFTRLQQCQIIEVNTEVYRPYLRANLSECSVLMARQGNRLFAAHVGYSQTTQIAHALESFRARGFDLDELRVVASTGAFQESQNQEGFPPRFASAEDYAELGIPKEHIVEFSYAPSSEDANRSNSLCEVVIGPDGTLLAHFDALTSIEGGFVREEILDETLHEELVDF